MQQLTDYHSKAGGAAGKTAAALHEVTLGIWDKIATDLGPQKANTAVD